MKSIFNKADNDSMIARINALTVQSKPLWGKMSVDQMFEHCSAGIDAAFGLTPMKINFVMRLLGNMLKKKVFYGGEMGKNSPTAKELIITGQYDFETSKRNLIERFSRFAYEGKECITNMNHPFWGKMTYEDWDALMWKHLHHHLLQFGV